MKYTTHLLVSTAVAIPIMANTGTLTVTSMLALSLGALAPDIDEPESYIGRRTRGVSDLIKLLFGHRGLTHTLVGLFFGMFLALLLGTYFINDRTLIYYFILGYFLHLLEDSFSKSSVMWLYPFTEKTIRLPFYYVTGSFTEAIIGFLAMGIIYFQLTKTDYAFMSDPYININNLTQLFDVLFNRLSRIFIR